MHVHTTHGPAKRVSDPMIPFFNGHKKQWKRGARNSNMETVIIFGKLLTIALLGQGRRLDLPDGRAGLPKMRGG